MRAILLVKDKEGLNDDRLQNSRYGLTGKPALTQQGIAGALSASFKAGQQVTMSNLRSLNEKLREAQKALDNAQNNIDKTEDTQDKMDEAKDEISKLLSTGLWEKMWQGQISPFEFYAGKYFEDVQYEAMCGEPGFPVQNIGEAISVAPIPRVPVWDPILRINEHSVNTNVESIQAYFGYYKKEDMVALISSASLEKIEQGVQLLTATTAFLSLSFYTEQISIAAFSKDVFPEAVAKLVEAYEKQLILSTIQVIMIPIMLACLLAIRTGKYKELGGTPDRAGLAATAAPSCFNGDHSGSWVTLLTINQVVSVALNAAYVTMVALTSKQTVINLFYALGAVLSNIPWAATKAAARGLATAASAMGSLVYFDMFSIALNFAMMMISMDSGIIIRNNGGKIDFGLPVSMNFMNIENPHPPSRTLGHHNWNLYGLFAQIKNDLKLETWASVIGVFSKLLSVASLSSVITPIITGAANSILEPYINSISEWDGLHTRVAIQYIRGDDNPSVQDWWGVSYPRISWNFNDKAAGVIGGGQYPAMPLELSKKSIPLSASTGFDRLTEGIADSQRSGDRIIDMRATVYPGDYFGTQKGIHLWEGKSVDRTVVIRAKATVSYNRIWYGFCVLVRFSGSPKLYLLMERDAVYGPMSFSPCTHCEQMIYNYNRKLLPMKQPYTSSRNGMLDYYYATITTPDSETTVQYRNVKGMKENWLEGQLINTEYTLGGDVYIVNLPGHGYTEGYINSYADQ